jgi:hypothetical protein
MPDYRDDRGDREEPLHQGRDDDDDLDERDEHRRDGSADDDDRIDFKRGPGYPLLAYVAGYVWAGFGTLILLCAVASFFMIGKVQNPARANRDVGAATGTCSTVLYILFGIAFFRGGFRVIKGTAESTILGGICTIAFSLLLLVGGFVSIGERDFALVGILFILGFSLLASGWSGYKADADYLEWKKFNEKGGRSGEPDTTTPEEEP